MWLSSSRGAGLMKDSALGWALAGCALEFREKHYYLGQDKVWARIKFGPRLSLVIGLRCPKASS